MTLSVPHLVVLSMACAASWTDLRTSKIPNGLTFGAAAAAVVYAGLFRSELSLASVAEGWIVGVLLLALIVRQLRRRSKSAIRGSSRDRP